MSDKSGYDNGDTPDEQEEDREELARERTDMAEDRTIMAVERTFAGWIRTAFAAIGIGLAFRVLFGELDPPWLAKGLASLFIAFAVFLSLSAYKRAVASLERMHPHVLERPDIPSFKWLSYGVALGAALLIAGLWVLNDGSLAS